MARLSDLTSAVAAASGVPDTAARVIARSLREAGLVSKGGRGLSAARMGASDVANILLAFASPADVTKAGQTVKVLAELEQEGTVAIQGMDGQGVLRLEEEGERTGLFRGQALGSALAMLVGRYSPEGRLPTDPTALQPDMAKPERGRISFAASGPRRTDATPCAITLAVTKDEYGWSAEVEVAERGGDNLTIRFRPHGGTWPPKFEREDNPGRSHRITLPPLIAHAAICCIRDDKPTKAPFVGGDQ